MRYRRAMVANATYFFTLNLQIRKSNLLIDHIDSLRFAFKKVQKNHPFYLDAVVIMPDHFHMMMTLPESDKNYPLRLSLIKSSFSIQIETDEHISASRKMKRERGIWQRRYWEHLIKDAKDYEHHINYIHFNPVKHGYVLNPSDWEHSSIHRFVRHGVLTEAWGCNDDFEQFKFGE